SNSVNNSRASILGGYYNLNSALNAVILTGQANRILSNAAAGSILGGANNFVSEAYSSVSGGWDNEAAGLWSVVSGGVNNTTTGDYSVVSGGEGNVATGEAEQVP
ncbi:MAG: hypothetical protein JSU96_07485, partial [Acidobacteriota bacterium]